MKINKSLENGKACYALEGRLDTTTAPELEKELKDDMDVVTQLTLDFSDLDYISSAGLRVLLSAHKAMSKKDGMKVVNVNEMVKEVQDNADTNMTDIEYNDNAAQVVTMSMNDAKDMTPQRSTGSYVDDAAMDSSVAADLLTGKTTVADTTAGTGNTVANSLSRRRGR